MDQRMLVLLQRLRALGSTFDNQNHDMDYAFSPNLGEVWQNNWKQPIANTSAQEPIVPVSAGITIFSIPKYGYVKCAIGFLTASYADSRRCSGILNQEAQVVDFEDRVHVLNRENTTGVEQWCALNTVNLPIFWLISWSNLRYHYWRSTTGFWTRTALPLPDTLHSVNDITGTPTVIGKRGKLVAPPKTPSQSDATLLAILPSNAPKSSAFSVISSTAAGHFRDWQVLWEAPDGCNAEPLYDRYRLQEDGILSLFLVNETEVQVLDFAL